MLQNRKGDKIITTQTMGEDQNCKADSSNKVTSAHEVSCGAFQVLMIKQVNFAETKQMPLLSFCSAG